MVIEQIYTGCLAQGAYYIESDGEAAVIDPLREVKPYLARAARSGANIRYVFETHFHADFVSGHVDLSRLTGAPVVYGPSAQPGFDALVATDGQVFPLGKVQIKLLHTPGHTMESASYLLIDEHGTPTALFSGDTLFIGDVGRPDLAQKAAGLTQEELAGILYDSLQNTILPLPDDVVVYPGHGAGSACGKNMSRETTDTLGHQKAVNYALRKGITRDEFIREVTAGLMPPPAYFPLNVQLNKQGYDSFDAVLDRALRPLDALAFEAASQDPDVLVLDTRRPDVFVAGFVPGAINIGLKGSFAPWAGALIPDLKQRILLITDIDTEEEAITRLARVGLDGVEGYLQGGFETWKTAGKAIDSIASITAGALAALPKPQHLLDVRKQNEFNSQHVLGAENMPLDTINDHFSELDSRQSYFVHCAGGYRSVIFISILQARGYRHLINVQGGFDVMKKMDTFALSPFVCPTSML